MEDLGFYLLRIPSYPIENYFIINEAIDQKSKTLRREKLKELFSDPYFGKAISLASSSVFQTYNKWIEFGLDQKSENRLIRTLYKYYVRMCTRTTPFGLFSGYDFGDIGDCDSDIQLHKEYLNYSVGIDLSVLDLLEDLVLKTDEWKCNQTLYTNNTIYNIGRGKIRFVDYSLSDNGRVYSLSEVNYSELLEYVLKVTSDGINYNELINNLFNHVQGANTDQISKYVDDLIESSIILPNKIDITNKISPTDQFIIKYDGQLPHSFRSILSKISLNNSLCDCDSALMKRTLRDEYNIELDHFLKVDLQIKTLNNRINKKVINEITNDIKDIRIFQEYLSSDEFTKFIKNFEDRFGTQEILLSEALDFDLGVGYGVQMSSNSKDLPLLKDLEYLNGKTKTPDQYHKEHFQFLYSKLYHYDNSNDEYITINQKDLNDSRSKIKFKENLLESSYVMGRLISNSSKDLDQGNYKFLPKSSIPSPLFGQLLGRFLTENDEYLKQVRHFINEVELKDESSKVYAEIIYNPGGKASNVVLRPNLYSYHIYIGPNKSHNIRSTEIRLQDLLVSIRNGEVFLRSKKLNKEVIPRLTSAHNSSIEAIPVYRFLCDLQFQNSPTGFNWNWRVFQIRDFLPRVIYKNIVLSPARWKLRQSDLHIIDKRISKILIKTRYCYLLQGDKELVLDLQNQYSVDILKSEVKKRDIQLYEFIDISNDSITKSCDGKSYISEVVIPFKNLESTSRTINKSSLNFFKSNDIQRKFHPGSEWITLKLYASEIVLDEILITSIRSLLLNTSKAEYFCWFFLRYSDPNNHLRIRIKINKGSIEQIMQDILEVCSIFIDSKKLYNISLDTYNRELERYGPKTIDLAESIFCNDSHITLEILSYIHQSVHVEDLKEASAFIGVDFLLKDFGFSTEQKFELMSHLSANFFEEFVDENDLENSSKELRRDISKKFRERKKNLNEIIYDQIFPENMIPIVNKFKSRSSLNSAIIKNMKKYEFYKSNRISLVSSFIHMHLNRLFNTRQRQQEMVVYSLLKTTYNSILKRNELN